jgi:hypothetical protein
MRRLLAVSVFAFLGACATSTTVEPVAVDTPPVQETVIPSASALAMDTVDKLIAAGNEQAAILRLQQLVGIQDATDAERAAALYRMAHLQYGDGNDVFGAIGTLDELLEDYPDFEFAADAEDMRNTARGEATSLNFALETDETLTPTERFEIMFRLGRHQDAADFMLARNLTPENAYLLDMYQVGYLCEDDELTGPAYDMVEPDGTARTLHFCEFGK